MMADAGSQRHYGRCGKDPEMIAAPLQVCDYRIVRPCLIAPFRVGDQRVVVIDQLAADADADPFLGADGPAERYIVERITMKDGKCWAEVHGVWEGKENETPDVTPELVLKNGRWLFVNFYFPSPSDPKAWNLLSALEADRELQKEYGSRNVKKP